MFMKKIENNLNTEQIQAVLETEHPVLVLSGAGTGKTRVITYKTAYLIAEKNIRAEKILALTFTNKAAGEMKERTYTLIMNHTQINPVFKNLWIGTFHSVCARMLRFHAKQLGYTPQFTITDTDDQNKLLKELIKEKKYLHLDKIGRVKEDISRAKNNFLEAEDLFHLGETKADEYWIELSKLYQDYNNYLLKNNTMDFDDLIVNPVKLLYQEPEIRAYWQKQFDYILVDEFQDTNKSQYLLLTLLMKPDGKNLTMVGDDDQSIYSFRGAAIENILSVPKDFKDLVLIKVVQNYRSTPEILDLANFVISNNKNRLGKELKAVHSSFQNTLPSLFASENDKTEAQEICQKMLVLSEEHPDWKLAVIYRTNAQSRIFETVLNQSRLSYTILDTKSFFDRKEIKDVIAYFRLIINPKDDLAFKRIVNIPLRGIGDVSVEKLSKLADEQNLSLFETLEKIYRDQVKPSLKPSVIKELKNFYLLISELYELSGKNPEKVLDILLDATDYKKFLDTYDNEAERIENLNELKRYYDSYFQEDEAPSFENFLAQLSLLDHSQNENDKESFAEKKIFLTTVHSCKGLEFDSVFITGLAEEIFPHYLSVSTEENLEEERRLFYVAVTRAKKHLSLSYPKTYFRNRNYEFLAKSRFIREIPADKIIKEKNGSSLDDLKDLSGFSF